MSTSAYYADFNTPAKIQVVCANYDFMAQIYRDAIEVDFQKKSSDLIHIRMNSENVVMAKEIIKEVIANYNAEWESDKDLVTDKTIEFVKERLQSVYDELLQADQSIQIFKDRNNLTDIESDIKYYLAISGELQPSLLEAEIQLKMIDIVVDFVNNKENKYSLFPLSPNMTDPIMGEMISKYNEILAQRNELSKSPAQSVLLKDLNELMESRRDVLLQSVGNIKKGLLIAVNDLKKKETELKNKIGKIPGIEKDYLKLRREQELQQTIYIFLLEMREQIGVKGVSLLPKLKVIDEPYVVNKPVEPNMMKVAITTLFFGGIALPLSAIYGFPLVNSYIRRRKEK
jgi:capsule polysaccharide export protein KpsE/RkpR